MRDVGRRRLRLHAGRRAERAGAVLLQPLRIGEGDEAQLAAPRIGGGGAFAHADRAVAADGDVAVGAAGTRSGRLRRAPDRRRW